MAERGYIREILDEASKEEGRAGTTCEQSRQRHDDETRVLHDHRRTSHFRSYNVRYQRSKSSSSYSSTPTKSIPSHHSIRSAWRNDASPSFYASSSASEASSSSTINPQTAGCAHDEYKPCSCNQQYHYAFEFQWSFEQQSDPSTSSQTSTIRSSNRTCSCNFRQKY